LRGVPSSWLSLKSSSSSPSSIPPSSSAEHHDLHRWNVEQHDTPTMLTTTFGMGSSRGVLAATISALSKVSTSRLTPRRIAGCDDVSGGAAMRGSAMSEAMAALMVGWLVDRVGD
jgi:hypothetical protein